MSTPDLAGTRTRSAWHEAAHVAVGFALGLEIVGDATIIPAGGITGLCHVAATLRLDGNGQRPPIPTVYRAEVEANVLCYLAGQHGAWQAPDPAADANPSQVLGRYLTRLEESSRDLAERIERGEPDHRPPDDYTRSLQLLVAYHGPEQSGLPGAWLELLDEEARHLVSKLRRPIGLLARELLDHDQVDAARLTELCEQNVAKPLLSQWHHTAILIPTDT